MSTCDQVFVPQIDLDLIKSEEINPLSELSDYPAASHDGIPEKDMIQVMETKIMVCCICLSTRHVSPLPPQAAWLNDITLGRRGVCDITPEGYSACHITPERNSAREMTSVGYSSRDITRERHGACGITPEGYSARDITSEGYSARDITSGEYSACHITSGRGGVCDITPEKEIACEITSGRNGVCVKCAGSLRAASKLVARARWAHEILRGLKGELDVNSVNYLKLKERPLVELTTKRIGPQNYDKLFISDVQIEQKNVCLYEVDVKIESNDNNSDFHSSDNESLKKEKKNKKHTAKERDGESKIAKIKSKRKPAKFKIEKETPIVEKGKAITEAKAKVVKSKASQKSSKYAVKNGRQTKQSEANSKLISKYFEMRKVPLEEQRASFIKRKMSSNYETAPFKCVSCYTGFEEASLLSKHVEEEKCKMQKRDSMTCPVCDKQCTSPSGLGKHMWWHSNCATYKCNMCKFKTNGKGSAKIHAGMHDGNSYQCNICGQTFSRNPSYLSHMRIKHPSDSVCALCGYSFIGEKGLNFHRALRHRGQDQTVPEDGPRCAECDIQFVSEEALNTHCRVSSRHGKSGINDIQREKLAKSKLERGDRRRRRPRPPPRDLKLLETADGIINCEQCGAPQTSRMRYRLHFAKYHSSSARTVFPDGPGRARVLCAVCGASVKNLTMHMELHNTTKKYRCPVPSCGKTLRTKLALERHSAVHRDPEFSCPTCGKQFNKRSNRDRHYTYVHSSVRDVKCEYCGKMYKSITAKETHVIYVHHKKPWPRSARRKRQLGEEGDDDII